MSDPAAKWKYIGFARDYFWLRLLWIAPLAIGVFVGLAFVVALMQEGDYGPMLFVAAIWLSVSVIVLLVVIDALHMLIARGPVVVVGPEGILDRRIMSRPLLWGDVAKIQVLTQEEKPITVGLWPQGDVEQYKARSPLLRRLGLAQLADLFPNPFAFAPLPVDLQTLDDRAVAVLPAVRRYWGAPEVRTFVPDYEEPPGD